MVGKCPLALIYKGDASTKDIFLILWVKGGFVDRALSLSGPSRMSAHGYEEFKRARFDLDRFDLTDFLRI